MTRDYEEILKRTVNRKEQLGMTDGFESAHPPLALPSWFM
jgi:hypothetical protein